MTEWGIEDGPLRVHPEAGDMGWGDKCAETGEQAKRGWFDVGGVRVCVGVHAACISLSMVNECG